MTSRLARLPLYARSLASCVRPSFLRFLPLWVSASRSVRGWLRMPDAFLLYRLAADSTVSGSIVEIGSAWGRSTIFLAAGLRYCGEGRVRAIDPHTGDHWFLEREGLDQIDSFSEFTANIRRFSLHEWVEPIVATSHAAAGPTAAEPSRLLFIDGLHTYAGIRQDIDDWVPGVAPGGVIVFDDYDNTEPGVGVRQAVDELLGSGMVEPKLRNCFNLVWTRRLSD